MNTRPNTRLARSALTPAFTPRERGEGEVSDFASTDVHSAQGITYIPMIAMSFTVPLTPAIFAASVAFPVARSTL